jgi:hypothetical protein
LPAKPRVEEDETALNRERETQRLGGTTGIPRETAQRNQGTDRSACADGAASD